MNTQFFFLNIISFCKINFIHIIIGFPLQVLIKVHSSGVNPVDTYVRAGQYKNLPNLPYTPGKDAAGLVHSVGPSVTRFKVSIKVFRF